MNHGQADGETMNRDDLFMLHDQLTRRARVLMESKNRDYGESDDPFRNFRRWGLLGILVRLGDKLARLETFVERGSLTVVTEQVRDTVLDVINYAVLFEGYNTDADSEGSRIGDTQEPRPARSAYEGPKPRVANSRAGDLGGDSRGGGRIAPAKTWSPADVIGYGFKVGTSSGNRGGQPVGSKSRRGGNQG